MNDEQIIGVQQESTIAIVSALKAYVDLLDDSKEAGQKEKVMKILTRPEKETYQICISILVGIVVGRLGMKVDNSKRTESCVNAVYYFDTNLSTDRAKPFKDKIFPNLDLKTEAGGKLSVVGNEALKWAMLNLTEGDGAKLITTGTHMATAIDRGIKKIPDDAIDRELLKKGSYLDIGENFLMGLFFAIVNKDLKIKF